MYFVYILASRRNGTPYTGVTNDLHRGLDEHRSGNGAEFTRRYGVTILVWFETHVRIDEAIAREKQIKGWNRSWKLRLIERSNSGWNDVAGDIPYD